MINVCVMYANKRGAQFKMSYYCPIHLPLVRKLAGAALLRVIVEEGIAGMGPPFRALGHL